MVLAHLGAHAGLWAGSSQHPPPGRPVLANSSLCPEVLNKISQAKFFPNASASSQLNNAGVCVV